MKRLAVIASLLLVITTAGACGGDDEPKATDWDPAALAVADGLVAELHAAKKPCNEYTHWDYPLLSHDYADKDLPIPAAVAACAGVAEEDLTIEVFADPAAKDAFVEAKRKLLCAASERNDINYPGFPYIDGGAWIFEPDETETAVALQKVLGGEVKTAGCDV